MVSGPGAGQLHYLRLVHEDGVSEKKMFGGVCHLLNGNMFCGVYKDYLMWFPIKK